MAKLSHFTLRMTEDIQNMIQEKAKQTGRSMNGEIIQAIIEHCQPDSLANQLYELGQRLNALESIVTPARLPSQESESRP